jgi:hypothetical protein
MLSISLDHVQRRPPSVLISSHTSSVSGTMCSLKPGTSVGKARPHGQARHSFFCCRPEPLWFRHFDQALARRRQGTFL